MTNINQIQPCNKFCLFCKKVKETSKGRWEKVKNGMKLPQTTNWLNLILSLLLTGATLFLTNAIYRPFDKEKIIVDSANEIWLYENYGNLTFEQAFSIRNNGKKQGVITSVDGLIVSNNGQEFKRHISAKNYSDYYQNIFFPFINIVLNADDKFEYSLHLFKESSPQDRKTEIEFINSCDEAKESTWEEYGNDVPPRRYFSEEYFCKIEKFIKNRFANFDLGEYQYIVAITKNNEEVPFEYKCYSFTILEVHLQVLNNAVGNYRKIYVINDDRFNNNKISVQKIRLKPISDKNTRDKLLRMLLDEKNNENY